jgi:hypothetical protein
MSAVTLWKRMGSFLRGDRGAAREFSPRLLGDAAHAESDAPAAPRRSLAPRGNGAYERVAELMDARQAHFERQDRRAEELRGSVDRVAIILERLADTQRAQSESISTIASRVHRASDDTARLAVTLSEVPATLATQAEVVRAISHRMQASHETDTQMVMSLQRFGSAVDSLRESGTVQVETLRRLHAGEHEQKEALRALIREQGRRFLLVAGVAGIVVLAALGALVAALVMALGR